MTCTGQTMAENLADVQPYPESQDIVRAFENPVKKDSHLRILYGNLAPEGAFAKISGKEGSLPGLRDASIQKNRRSKPSSMGKLRRLGHRNSL